MVQTAEVGLVKTSGQLRKKPGDCNGRIVSSYEVLRIRILSNVLWELSDRVGKPRNIEKGSVEHKPDNAVSGFERCSGGGSRNAFESCECLRVGPCIVSSLCDVYHADRDEVAIRINAGRRGSRVRWCEQSLFYFPDE